MLACRIWQPQPGSAPAQLADTCFHLSLDTRQILDRSKPIRRFATLKCVQTLSLASLRAAPLERVVSRHGRTAPAARTLQHKVSARLLRKPESPRYLVAEFKQHAATLRTLTRRQRDTTFSAGLPAHCDTESPKDMQTEDKAS